MINMFRKEQKREPSKEELQVMHEVLDTMGGAEGAANAYADMFYHYDYPDYTKGLQPVHAPLKVLISESNINTDDTYETICEKMERLSHNKQVNEVSNLIQFCLSRWHSSYEGKDEMLIYPIRVCTALIEHFQLKECLPAYLEILKQDNDFMNAVFLEDDLDWMLPGILYQIIDQDDLPELLQFMLTPGLLFASKKHIAMAVATLPRKDNEAMPAVHKWLAEVINTYAPMGAITDMFDEGLLDTLIYCCVHTQFVDFKDKLISLYSKYRIPSIMVEGGVNEVRKTIKNASIGALPKQDESGENIFLDYLAGEDEYDDDYDEDEEEGDYDWQKFAPFAMCNKAIYKPILTTSHKKYTLHIQLQDIRPAIYRDIEVPSNLRLDSLAGLILTAMGWQDEHLHQFVTYGRNPQYYSTSPTESENEFEEYKVNDGREYCIGDLLHIVGDKIKFEYDFGDDWIHEITLTAISNADKKPKVSLIDGKRACPPEDCGGTGGYEELCDAMKDIKSDIAKEMLDWLGCKYDPELFSLDVAQKLVNKFNRK